MSQPAAVATGQVVIATNPPYDRQTRLSVPTGLVLYFNVGLWVFGGGETKLPLPLPKSGDKRFGKLI